MTRTPRTWYGEPLEYWRVHFQLFGWVFAVFWFATDWWGPGALAVLCAVCGWLFWCEEEKERWGV